MRASPAVLPAPLPVHGESLAAPQLGTVPMTSWFAGLVTFGAAVVSIHPSAVDITTLAKQPIVFGDSAWFVPDLNFDQIMAA